MVLILTGSVCGAEVVVDSEADVDEDDEDEVVLACTLVPLEADALEGAVWADALAVVVVDELLEVTVDAVVAWAAAVFEVPDGELVL